MEKTQIEIELLTPTYLGGANSQPEFRIPSIKGLLRFWLRAIDPNYRKWEPRVFGDASDRGAAPIMLRIGGSHGRPRICHLLREPDDSSSESCIPKRNMPGLEYLAFPMGMEGGIRDALAPKQRFVVECLSRLDQLKPVITARFSMAWWAMVTIGGIGSRSRRGFGSLAFADVKSDWKSAKLLKAYAGISTMKQWYALFERALELNRKWFGTAHDDTHFHIGRGTRFLLLGGSNNRGFGSWFAAMDYFGSELKMTRSEASPEEKAALGLPIDGKGLKITPEQKSHERGASPLMANVVRVSDKYYVLLTFSRSPVCAEGEQIRIKKRGYRKRAQPDYGILDSMYNDLSPSALYRKEVK